MHYEATLALALAEIAVIAKRLVVLGRPRNKAIGDVARSYGLTSYQVKIISTLV